jgi:outer membrane receptor protein involved in Fe transport
MSLQPVIPGRVALQQRPPPLRRSIIVLSRNQAAVKQSAANGNLSLVSLSQHRGAVQSRPSPDVVYQTASSQSGLPVPTPGGTGFSNVYSTLTTYRDITTRKNLYLDLGYIQNLFGQQHNFKFGYAFNRVGNDVLTDYPNGDFNIFWGQTFSRANISNVSGTYGYYTWEDGVRLNSKVNGRNQGLYFQDEWRFNRRLTLNLGVRLENEYLPPYRSEQGGVKIANPVSFNWGDKVAPRLGFAYDVLGDGRWKLSGSMGYFYDVLKYNLARGSFGGEFWVTHVYQLNSPNVLNLTKANAGLLGTEITSYDNRTVPINAQGQLDGIDSNLKPYTSRNFNFALDHKLTSQLTASIRYVRKDLLKTIEDIGVLDSSGNEVYLIGNPGFGQTRNDPTHTYDGKTPNGQEYLVPKAVRQYNAVEFRLQGQIGKLFLAPSYTWSRLYGNYSGLGNSDESGRSNPDNNRSFDLPYYYFDASGSQKNVFGLLGTDRTHAFNLYSSYAYKNKLGSTVFGLVQVAESGTPDSTSIIYLSAPTYPYGRGDLGRTPFYTQTDIQISHTISIAEKVKVRLEANVQNLFNQDAILSRDSQYNRSGAISATALPVSQFFAGYDPTKFISSGVPYNPIYGLPGSSYRNGGGPGSTLSSAFSAALPGFEAYQSGRVFRLGMRVQF